MEVKGEKSRPRPRGEGRRRLRREDWVAAALRRLATSGIDAVRVEVLATDLGVTKGSFYWHFKDRPDLLDTVLREWETSATVAGAVPEQAAPSERMARFLELVTAYAADPDRAALESAVLAWAQKDAAVADRVAAIEAARTANAERLLAEVGFPPSEAAAWADIGYTTVVGMMSRSTRDPRFRRWPRSDYLTRVVDAARSLVEHRDTSTPSGDAG
jgi:AcrR family transcriptional regulator